MQEAQLTLNDLMLIIGRQKVERDILEEQLRSTHIQLQQAIASAQELEARLNRLENPVVDEQAAKS